MRDYVLEYCVIQKPKLTAYVLPAVFFALAASSFILMLNHFYIGLPLIVVFVFLGMRFYDKIYTEIDYLFVNGSLTLDYVYRRKRRKPGIVIERNMVRDIYPFAPQLLQGVSGDDFSSRVHPNQSYIIFYDAPQGRRYAVIEPTDKLLSYLKKIFMSKFHDAS